MNASGLTVRFSLIMRPDQSIRLMLRKTFCLERLAETQISVRRCEAPLAVRIEMVLVHRMSGIQYPVCDSFQYFAELIALMSCIMQPLVYGIVSSIDRTAEKPLRWRRWWHCRRFLGLFCRRLIRMLVRFHRMASHLKSTFWPVNKQNQHTQKNRAEVGLRP